MIPSTSNMFGGFFTMILGIVIYLLLKLFGVENNEWAIGISFVLIIIYITIKDPHYIPFSKKDGYMSDDKRKDEGIEI